MELPKKEGPTTQAPTALPPLKAMRLVDVWPQDLGCLWEQEAVDLEPSQT